MEIGLLKRHNAYAAAISTPAVFRGSHVDNVNDPLYFGVICLRLSPV